MMARRRRRKGKLIKGLSLGLQGILQAGVYALKFGPGAMFAAVLFLSFFGIKNVLYADAGLLIQRIEVTPEGAIPQAQVERLEKTYIGKNILSLDLEKISRRLQADPHVIRAKVGKVLPNVLTVRISQRNTAAVLQWRKDGPFALLSADGMVLDLRQKRPSSFVLIESHESGLTRVKKGTDPAVKGLSEALTLYALFQKHPIAADETVSKMTLDHLGNVAVFLQDNLEIRFGKKTSAYVTSMTSLRPILTGEDRRMIDYIDLQYGQVIVKKKAGR